MLRHRQQGLVFNAIATTKPRAAWNQKHFSFKTIAKGAFAGEPLENIVISRLTGFRSSFMFHLLYVNNRLHVF